MQNIRLKLRWNLKQVFWRIYLDKTVPISKERWKMIASLWEGIFRVNVIFSDTCGSLQHLRLVTTLARFFLRILLHWKLMVTMITVVFACSVYFLVNWRYNHLFVYTYWNNVMVMLHTDGVPWTCKRIAS